MSKARQRSGQRKRREHIDPFAQFRLMQKLQPFTPAELSKLNLKPRLAWEAMRTGHASDDDRGTISAVVNASLVRCEAIDPAMVEVCKVAQQALARIRDRHQRTGSSALSHQDIEDIAPVLDLHEQLLELSTPLEMERALLEVLRRAAIGETL
jgi:hypothetical protein